MRVLLNGLAALKPKTGVGHHVVQLHRQLESNAPDASFTLYPGQRIGSWIASANRPAPPKSPGKPRSSRTNFLAALRGSVKEFAKLASAIHFRGYARSFGFDLYHEPNFVPYCSHLPTVVTVHDLSVVRFPQWHPADRVRFHDRHFHRGIERAEHIIVVSEAVRRETIELLGVPPHRVTAVHNGLHPGFRPAASEEVAAVRERLQLPGKYFLSVGTIEPRKNLGTVMRAYADLPRSLREACPLVLAGPWGWKSDAEREFFESTGKAAGIRHLGYVPDADLPGLYAGASALLYPSFYEGFGFPPLEMLAVGGTVIASTDPAVREVMGEHATLLPAQDLVAWRDAMRRQILEPTPGSAARRIAHAGNFTWDRAAHETLAVYRQVLGIAEKSADSPASPRAAA